VNRRIPRTIRLPFGYTIRVEQVTKREMEDECGEFLDGAWMAECRTIYLRRSLTITRKRYVLCHELQHAVADLTHQHLNDGIGKP
jgi:Zn-dependent peptidase ImmA (M78 family)